MKKIIIIILILVAIVIGFVIYNGTTKEYQALSATASISSGQGQVDQLLFVHADTIGSEEVDAFLRTGSFDQDEDRLFEINGFRQSNYRDNRNGPGNKSVVTGFEVEIDNPSEGVYWMLVDVQGDILLSRLEDVDFDPTGQRIFESDWENLTGDRYYEGTMKLELIQFAFHPDN